jgi:hypothetical protein
MKKLITLIAIGIAIQSGMAMAAGSSVDSCLKLDCHADSRACLERLANRSEQSLSNAKSSFLENLSQWDEEPQYKARTEQWLAKSDSTFKQYRRTQCELQASLSAGGNSAGDRKLMCLIRLNDWRITELREAESLFTNSK